MRTGRSASVLAILSTLILSSVCWATPQILITENVDESKLLTLAGNTRPEANKQNDHGLVADDLLMEHMLLQLKRSPALEQKLRQFIDQLHNPSSPNFHHWLTPKQYGQRFGLAKQDLDTITRWLESHGFKVNVVYDNGILIDFSGTAVQVRSAFHTEIHELNVKGVKHIANMSDPRIPAALAPVVVGIVSLHDFRPHAMYKPRASYTDGACLFGTCYLVVPGDLATIYNLNPLFTAGISGQGQTVVVIEDTDLFTAADWTTFRSTFGLSSFTAGSFTQVHPAPGSGTNNCTDPGVNGDDIEATLDAEYASAAAPSAAIVLASCSDTLTTFGGLFAIQNLLSESSTPPSIMSMSYGECEAGNGAASNAAFNSAFQQADSEGVSVFVSTGDEGAASCNANDPAAWFGIGVSGWASTPYNVAVGGTDFSDTYASTNSVYWSPTNSSTYESALSYVPEIPWNDSCAGELLANYVSGSSQTYGPTGFCNTGNGSNFLTTASGSGGPSGCATGSPSTVGVVGGTCAGYPKPSWQSLVGNPNDGVRDLPDVSLFAANGVWDHYYPFCFSDVSNGGTPCTGTPDNWTGAGGTSFSTPIMAGIQALVNQNAGGAQGNPNPVYYGLAATEYGAGGSSTCNSTLGNAAANTCIFYDVTQGDMDVNCIPLSGSTSFNCYFDGPTTLNGVLSTSNSSYAPAFGTTTGWDFATGIGTVNAFNLVIGFAAAIADFNMSSTGSSELMVPAGETTPATYQFTFSPQGTATTYGEDVTFACSFSPPDPTLTNSSCSLSPASIPGTQGAAPVNVTMSITTAGPNQPSRSAKPRQRADNHSPRSPWIPLSLPIAGVILAGLAGRRLSRYSVLASLCIALVMAGLLVACGGGNSSSSPPPAIAVSVAPGTPANLYPNCSSCTPAWPSATATFTATVTNDSASAGVTWSCSGDTPCGTFNPTSTASGAMTTYTSPSITSGLTSPVTIIATSVTDSTKTGRTTEVLNPATVPQTYQVTVTATKGTHVHSQQVSLVVQ